MFKQPKIPSPEPKPLGVDPARVSSNESAVPLPWAVGKNRIALKWISPAFNQKTTAITQRVGKRNQTTGYNVYADIAGAVCAGPVDGLEKIIIDGVVVWASANAVRNGTNPHYYQGTVPGYGRFRIYWGTSTQPKDTLILDYAAGEEITWDDNEQPWEFPNRSGTTNQSVTYTTAACPDDHPAYFDQCYVVWSQLFCGQNRESVPNVEVIVTKKARPFPAIDPDLTDEGVNPVFAVAELLTNELYGAGLPASAVDVTQWNGVATVAANLRTFARPTAPNTPVSVPFGHISALIDRQTTVRQALNELFLYFDGYARPRNGMLEVGCFPHDGVTPAGLTTLTLQDDTSLPEYQPGSWNDTISQATVVHRDYALDFKENAETCQQPLALAITGQPRRENIDRPHFITRWQAQDYAARWARIHAHPQNLTRGRIRVRTERAVHSSGQPLLAGDRFIFDYQPYSLQLVARITNRKDDSTGGETTLGWEAERGIAPLPYVTAGDTRPNVEQIVPTGITNARVFQLPPEYLGEPTPAVVALCERPAAAVVGFNTFFSASDSSYDLAGNSQNWAVRGTLGAGIAGGSLDLTLAAGGLDIAKLQPQSTEAQKDNTLLLFVGSEVMSVGAVTALGGGQYSVNVLRGRFGSAASSHSSGAVVYVIPRADMAVFTNANFPRTASVKYFKLQTYTVNDEQALASALKITFTFADRGVGAPTSLSATAQNNGVFLKWNNPADLDLAFIEIFERDSSSPTPLSSDAPTYTIFGNTFLRGGLAGGVSKYFWVRAVDTIGDKSVFVGPETATATTPAPGNDAKVLSLTSDSQQFKIAQNGTVTPSSIVITASGQNLTGSPTFSVVSGTATLTGTGNSRTLTYANTGTDFVVIRASWDGLEENISIVKVRDGVDGGAAKNLSLTADYQVFQIAKSGAVSPAVITFTVTGANLSGSPVFTVPSGNATLSGSGNSRTLSFASMSADTASVAVTWDGLNDVISIAKLREGTDGSNGTNGTNGTNGADAVVSFLTNEAHVVAASPEGVVGSFAGASTQMKVFKGQVDDTANWTFSRTDNGTTSTLAGNEVTVTALPGDTGYIDIAATRAGYGSQTKRFTLSKSKTGQTGLTGTAAKLVTLNSTAQVFQVNKAGAVNPATITFTAAGQSLTGNPTFSITAGTATLTGTGTTRSLAYADMSTDAVTVRVQWDGVEDRLSIVKVREGVDGSNGTNGTNGTNGADAIVAFLTNEAHTVPADASGVVTSFAGASAQMVVYRGAADDSGNWTFTRTNTNATSNIAGAVVTVTALSADIGYVDITAARAGFASITKRFTVSKSKAGQGGLPGANAKLVALTSTAQTFQVSKAGAQSPASITFTATAQNLAGSPTFTVAEGTAVLTGTGTSRVLAYADMTSDYVTVRVQWDGVEDRLSVVKVREGADGTNGTNGTNGADAVTALLSNEAHLVPASSAGVVSSFAGASTRMTVYRGSTNDTANWSFAKIDTSTSSTLDGNEVTVTGLSADTGYVDIIATRSGFNLLTKRFTVSKSKAGQQGNPGVDSKLVFLAGTAQAFQISKTGANTPASITLTATGQNLTGEPTWAVSPDGAATLTGTGATRTLSFADMSADYAAITVTWDGVSDTFSVVKVREGIDGNNGTNGTNGADAIVALLTNEAHNVTADASGVVTTFVGASTEMVVYRGVVNDTANWTITRADTNTTTTLAGALVTVTALSADVGYVDITASRVGFASITKRFTITKSRAGSNGNNGNDGQRGSKKFYASGTSWTDAAAEAAITAANLTKVLLDEVTISGTNFAQSRFWSGTEWVQITQVIDGNLLVNGTVGASAISTASLSAISADLGTVTAGTITANAFINVGTGTAQVQISNAGLRIANGRINMAGNDGAPTIRMFGAGAFANYLVEINGSTGAVAPVVTSTGGGYFTSLTASGLGTNGSYQLISGATFAGKIDASNTRFTIGSTTNHSVAIITGNAERVFIGADGHLKMNGGQIRKISDDGWTPQLWDGTNAISFGWIGDELRVRIDGIDIGVVQVL